MTEYTFSTNEFYAVLAEEKLVGSKCKKCGYVHFPPRQICSECFSEEMEPLEFSGKGTLEAYTIVHIASTAMIEAGYGRKNPHCAGIVRLEEGPTISAQILGVDVLAPETIKIGTPLQAVFIKRGNEDEQKTYLGFQA